MRTRKVSSVALSPDGTRIVTGSGDNTAKVWDARSGTTLLDLKGHADGVSSVAFSPDGRRIVTGSVDNTAKVWDALSGTPLLDLKGHEESVVSVAFSPDGTRIVTHTNDNTARVWDAGSGKELTGASMDVLSVNRTSPDGRVVAYITGKRVLLIPSDLTRTDLVYRIVHTRPNSWRYLAGFKAARKSKDKFAESFYLDRLLSLPEQRTTERFRERLEQTDDPLLMARTAFHHVDFTMALYDVVAVETLADLGNRLAKRIVAQGYLRDGKPELAVPILEQLLRDHPDTAPPVEQLLLSKAHLTLNERDKAKVYYQAAVDWLDRPSEDGPTKKVIELEKELFKITKPLDDPRYNPFQWELWHECDVFRAEVEKALRPSVSEPANAK